jgi:hypothetical protein
MVVLLLLGYAAICVVIFKFLHVPVNKWSLTTANAPLPDETREALRVICPSL